MKRLDKSTQKTLALGLLALSILITLSLTIIPAIVLNYSFNETIITLDDRLKRYQRIANKKPILQKQLKSLQQNYSGRDYYLKSKGESLASAELTKLVKRTIKRNGGEIISTRVISNKPDKKTKKNSTFKKITIKVEIRGNINALQKVLYKLEMGKPLLFIDAVRIRSRNRFRRNSRSNNSADTGNLDIRMEISGYMKI